MSVDYLGSLTIGGAAPGGLALAAAGQAGIGLALPDIQARLTALASFAPTPPSLQGDIALAQSIIASLQAAIAVGVQPPSMDAQVAIVAALVAQLSASMLAINAQLTIIANFASVLSSAGIHAYAFSGQADQLGPELTVELSGGPPGGAPTDATNGLVFVTTLGATWAAMGQFFKTTA
jgi:hypothetical protein